MAEKLSAAVFAKFVKERAQAKDGYIMGSRGQDPKKWAKNSWWFTQYKGSQKKKALYWRENAQRVWAVSYTHLGPGGGDGGDRRHSHEQP